MGASHDNYHTARLYPFSNNFFFTINRTRIYDMYLEVVLSAKMRPRRSWPTLPAPGWSDSGGPRLPGACPHHHADAAQVPCQMGCYFQTDIYYACL